MSEISRDDFLKAVLKSGLVERVELDKSVTAIDQGQTQPTMVLAKRLVETRVLTKYQAERLLAGRTEGFFLGGCKVLDRLGAGGMGAVYLAEQVRLGRQVALKVLPAQFAQDAEFVTRFQCEARAAAALDHRNIVQVYDVGQEGRTYYMIMQWVRGVNLALHIQRVGPYAVGESVDLIAQAAEGLAHAHAHGIIHRDIKPANLVVENGTLKILDLGLARRSEAGTVTRQGTGMGTPDYMSPEQFDDAHEVDARSDLYSLGCTWYHLLSGKPPFHAKSQYAKALAHLKEPLPPLDDAPPGIWQIIERLTAKLPEDRCQSAAELLDQIAGWRATPEAVTTGAARTA